MNAEFFALAFLSALNPKLLALDLLLIENRRPRAMFLCLLLGGMTVALTIGLLDVLVFRADAIKAQGTVSAGVDLALGLLLLAAGALLATGRLHGRRKAPIPAGDAQPGQPEKKDGWAQRALAEPRLGLAMLVGALIGIQGAAQAHPGLAAGPRRSAHDGHRPAPGRLPCRQRPGPAQWLTGRGVSPARSARSAAAVMFRSMPPNTTP
jgi:Sap, sulfolipid-1-addressing protein